MYAVAGVTGHTGKVVAETLLAAGKSVRVVVRDAAKGAEWAARGAEVAVADLGDPAALAAALQGTEGAWLLLPPRVAPGFAAYQRELGAALVEGVRRGRPGHVVFLSSIGAQLPAGTGPIAGLHPVEQGLRAVAAETGIAVTLLRAGYFMENLGGSLGALAQGVLPGFVPTDLPIDMIATQDIGAQAAELLLEGGAGVQVVELGGGPGYSMADCAEALSELTGKAVAAIEAPLDSMVETLTGFGFPADLAELYREMNAGFVNGHIVWEGGHQRVPASTPPKAVLAGLLGA